MTLEEFKKAVFEEAKREGFSECEIYYSSEKALEVGVFEGEMEKYEVSGNQGISFRGIYKGKMGYASTEILDEEAAYFVVASAKENATIIENDDLEIIYGGDENYSQLSSFSEELSKVRVNEKIKLAYDLEREGKKQDKNVLNAQSEVIGTEIIVKIMNSKGLNLSHKANMVIGFMEMVVKNGERKNADYAFKVANNFEDIDALSLAKEAAARALSGKGAKTVKSGKYKIALKNDVAANLIRTFSVIFSADNVQKGMSLLKDKVGESIGSSSVTIMDDPLLKDGANSSPFDAEGVATYTKEVVKEGKLKTLLHNLKTAAKEGVNSTGNASKSSYSSPVEVAPSNFFFKPGIKSYEEIVRTLNDGIVITSLEGLHSGANAISGDFSLAAKGMLVKNGKIERAVEQITISGNFYDVLKNIEELASDLKFGFPSGAGCFGSPTIIVKEIAVAGE